MPKGSPPSCLVIGLARSGLSQPSKAEPAGAPATGGGAGGGVWGAASCEAGRSRLETPAGGFAVTGRLATATAISGGASSTAQANSRKRLLSAAWDRSRVLGLGSIESPVLPSGPSVGPAPAPAAVAAG